MAARVKHLMQPWWQSLTPGHSGPLGRGKSRALELTGIQTDSHPKSQPPSVFPTYRETASPPWPQLCSGQHQMMLPRDWGSGSEVECILYSQRTLGSVPSTLWWLTTIHNRFLVIRLSPDLCRHYSSETNSVVLGSDSALWHCLF